MLVELKARFDEKNNIAWATRLESAGIHVVYGLVNIKVHCKLCLVVRKETGGIRRYAHVATGNYNRTTSRRLHRPRPVHRRRGHRRRRQRGVQHADRLFEQAQLPRAAGGAGRAAHRHPRRSSSARSSTPWPAGRRGIIIKNNAVADLPTIRTLFKASQAGVPIDLIVRGVCCLRPGVPGISDRIRVRSIVGRLLEHSRLYFFENGGDHELYIGSADLMERNLDRRVEVLVPGDRPRAAHAPARGGAGDAARRHRPGLAADARAAATSGRRRPTARTPVDAQKALHRAVRRAGPRGRGRSRTARG